MPEGIFPKESTTENTVTAKIIKKHSSVPAHCGREGTFGECLKNIFFAVYMADCKP